MIREVIRPQYNNFTISIPSSYINKDVEFIMFPLDEPEIVNEIKKQDISVLGGSLNKYANPLKMDSEDNAWEQHVMDKYK